MEYFKLKGFKTRQIMQTNDIDGAEPAKKWRGQHNPLRTDDIDGAVPPIIPGYGGTKRIMKTLHQDKLNLK